MRRAVPVVIAAATIATASAGFAWASQPGGSAGATTASRQPVHAVLWIGDGSLESCGPHECGAGQVDRPFTMPGHGTYVASVTLSFQYKTRGTGEFVAGIGLDGPRVLPHRRELAPAVAATTATLVFRTHLVGGRSYDIAPTVHVAHASGSYSINQRALLVEIDATPRHAVKKAGTIQRTEHTWTPR